MKRNDISLYQPRDMNPWFLTGFTDDEGCFLISICRNKEIQTGWQVQLYFTIALHNKDKKLLELIKTVLGVGKINKQEENMFRFRVSSRSDLKVILNHFDKYPMITQKQVDYLLFKQAYELMERKEHLTKQGLYKLVAIKASINWGLSDELKAAFPDITPVIRPLVQNLSIPNPNWLAGFTNGEGCFLINIYKSKTKWGEAVKLCFNLTQCSRDEQLMKSFIELWESL